MWINRINWNCANVNLKSEQFLALDARLSARLTAWVQSPVARFCAALLAHSGDELLWLGGGALLWWLGAGVWRNAGVRIVGVVALASGLSFLLKLIIRRPRPDGVQAHFYTNFDRCSFPSGHATRVAALAAALSPWLPLPGQIFFTVWVVAVCLSRVALGLHFLSDVLGGALLGLTIGGTWLLLGG